MPRLGDRLEPYLAGIGNVSYTEAGDNKPEGAQRLTPAARVDELQRVGQAVSKKVLSEHLTDPRAVSRIFLSYRRDDGAGFAGRLADDLEEEFGKGSVFRDVDDIRPGEDFIQAIEAQLREVGVVLVMIGPRWLAAGAGGRRRLDEPGDFVRQEIQAALASGKPIIPLLVGGAMMPPKGELPDTISSLARRQAVVLSDENWRSDVERLVVSLRPLLPDRGGAPVKRRWILGLAGAVVGLVGIGGVIQLWRVRPPGRPTSASPPSIQAVDVSGRWAARVKYDWGDEYDEVFEFKYLGDALHGTATYQTGRLTIERVSVKGDWINFVTRSQEMLGSNAPWKEVTHRYAGQVTPDAIRFTMESGGGYTIHPPVEFTARRAPKP